MRNNKVWFYVGLVTLATVSTAIFADQEDVPFPPDATEQKQHESLSVV